MLKDGMKYSSYGKEKGEGEESSVDVEISAQ